MVEDERFGTRVAPLEHHLAALLTAHAEHSGIAQLLAKHKTRLCRSPQAAAQQEK
jgi:hypothetical protein